MSLSIRSQAAIINEKSPDPELAYDAFARAVYLYQTYADARIGSSLTDMYEKQNPVPSVTVHHTQIERYLGTGIESARVEDILGALGYEVKQTKVSKDVMYEITPPTWRRNDTAIPEDIIEEVARIYGYHNISSVIPGSNLQTPHIDPIPETESDIKVRLRDWGYTEIYTYSMLSKDEVELFGYDVTKTYKITNPLTDDHVYMRPSLLPGILSVIRKNQHIRESLRLFELSNIYLYQANSLPREVPCLIVAVTGESFRFVKGLAEYILSVYGIEMPSVSQNSPASYLESNQSLSIQSFGQCGVVCKSITERLEIHSPVTILELNIEEIFKHSRSSKRYTEIPKFPPVREDLSFVFDMNVHVGDILRTIKSLHPLISAVSLLDTYKESKTFSIEYLDPKMTLTDEKIRPIREKIIQSVKRLYKGELKSAP